MNPASGLTTPDSSGRAGLGSADWVTGFGEQIREELSTFLAVRAGELAQTGHDAEHLGKLAGEFVGGGKYLRSTFAYLGWCTRAEESRYARRAAASLELLHSCALIHDDVMDGSTHRRGRATVHTTLSSHHRRADLGGDSAHFGTSAAIVLGDLFLVWSEQLLRNCGLGRQALDRAWDCYDSMRQELALGQYLDLLNNSTEMTTFEQALRVARLKSARYTVSRPLLLGARLAGADPAMRRVLADYGDVVGEAFQMRDDMLGLFGDPATTGKATGEDLRAGKATTVMAAAMELGGAGQRERLRQLLHLSPAERPSIEQIRTLVIATGAREHIEARIGERIRCAAQIVDTPQVPGEIRTALTRIADRCAHREN